MRHRHEIGSLGALFAFEAAGRLGSFTRAADELGVSQAAVSKQVANLEANLGQPLFQRLHREVRLTRTGLDLFHVTTEALASISQSMRSLRRNETVRPVTIAATMTTAHFWLMPLLTRFKQAQPNMPIRLLVEDTPVDLRTGAGPMASPPLVAARDRIAGVDDLLDWPWVSYDTPGRSWVSWSHWLKAAGCKGLLGAPTLSCTRYSDAIQAACAGQGVVLVWGGLTGGIEERGELIRLPGPAFSPLGDLYLVQSLQAEANPGCALLSAWLTSEARRHGTANASL